ncbi:MAG TPA: hypothetical protein VII63_06905 [Caulobacteraceae bacterium]
MADVLAAASMLLAIVAVLFGVWNGDVVDAIRIDLEDLRANRRPQRTKIVDVLLAKALPLTAGAWLTVAVFAPRSLALIGAARACRALPTCRYDDVGAAFVLTEFFVVLIAVSASVQLLRLIATLWASYGPDTP